MTHIYTHSPTVTLFLTNTNSTHWRIDSIFDSSCCLNWIATCRRMNLCSYLLPHTKLSFKWIKDLNLRPDTLSLIEKDARNRPELIGLGKDLFNRTFMRQELRSTIGKQMETHEAESVCTASDTILLLKRHPRE